MTVCGVPERVWPYACSVDTENGLRFDPNDGTLWYPPARNEYGAMIELYPTNSDQWINPNVPIYYPQIPYYTWTAINWTQTSISPIPTPNLWRTRRDVGSNVNGSTRNWIRADNPTRLICPGNDPCFAGWYQCVLNVAWGWPSAFGGSLSQFAIGIRLNGSGSGGNTGYSGGGLLFRGNEQKSDSFFPRQSYSREIYLRPGDSLEGMVVHTSPNTVMAVSGSFSVRWVGAEDPNTVGGGVSGNAATAYPAPIPGTNT